MTSDRHISSYSNMASLQQQQTGIHLGSNRIAAVDVTPPYNTGPNDLHTTDQEVKKPAWKKFLSFVGPGFLVSMAYIDPGSMETDLQAGSNHRYELLWVLLVGVIFALIIQSLAANLGVTTGKHLSEVCKAEYPKLVKYCLWLQAEVAVIVADVPEVIGTAFALNILFKIPLWVGVLLTGFSTLVLIGLQRYGVRKLELFVAVLVFVMAGCFFGEVSYVDPPASEVLKGMFVPKLKGQSAIADSIALLGALIMPHNLFLHSALVLSRKVPGTVRGINDACRFFLLESGMALVVAFLINVAMISVTGAICYANNISSENADRCSTITLDSASFLLENVLGKSAKYFYAIALLASGQSSAIAGTYAGQFIMQGFLDLRMKKWKRNLMTRVIAIAPSLVVSIIGGSSGSGKLIIIASMILSFELPFSLIPLLKFSSSSRKMGPHKNSITIIIISWILGFGIIGINVYYLSTAFVGWLIHSTLPKVANFLISIVVFPLMAIYALSVIYLTFRKDMAVTYTDPTETQIEKGLAGSGRSSEMTPIPYREDLADIPLRD